MPFVGRFEILSPVFSGAVETSTARDPKTGDTVLLHMLPPGHEESPREFFLELAPGCPGKVLDSGIDAETKRAFVVTDYPKDRKAVRLWIRQLAGLGPPAPPRTGKIRPDAAQALDTSAPQAKAPEKPPETPPARTARPDPFAPFKTPPPAPKLPIPPPAPAGDGATRMFDPSAVFGGPSAAAKAKEPAAPPPQDGATRMFDPSAVFGGAPPAPKAKPKEPPPPPPQDGATRMFDPSAVFGAAAPASQDSAGKTKEKTRPQGTSDSARQAAEDFIYGRLPAEVRSAPTKVQRSPKEFASKDTPPPPSTGNTTPGRPGVITLLFDAFGKRIDKQESEAAGEQEKSEKDKAADTGATKMLSSSDLSAFFGARKDGADKSSGSRGETEKDKSSPQRERK